MILALIFFGISAACIWALFEKRRVRREIERRRRGYRECLKCGYPRMRGVHRCSECGSTHWPSEGEDDDPRRIKYGPK